LLQTTEVSPVSGLVYTLFFFLSSGQENANEKFGVFFNLSITSPLERGELNCP
jgi:hypothetical protein